MKMKNVLKGILLMFLMLIPVGLFAQDGVPPTNIGEWVTRIPELLGTFWGTGVSHVLLVPVLIGLLNLTEAKKSIKYLFAGAVGAILILLATFLPFGFLYGAVWYGPVIAFVLIVGGQIVGYAIWFLKPIWDGIADKLNFWKTV
jgi:hypothetical protein